MSEMMCGRLLGEKFTCEQKKSLDGINSGEPVADIFIQDPIGYLSHVVLFDQLCYFTIDQSFGAEIVADQHLDVGSTRPIMNFLSTVFAT